MFPRIYDIIALLLVLSVCRANVGCADDAAQRAHSLNSNGQTVSVGGVYLLEPRHLVVVADLLSSRPLNEDGGLVECADGSSGRRMLGVCSMPIATAGYCCVRSPICWLEVDKSQVDRLDDPYDCLQIVNRPITGLAYNRDAEIRVNQWRTSIAAAIDRHLTVKGPRVVLCTSVEKMTKGKFVIDGTNSEDQAYQIQETICGPTGLRADWARHVKTATGRVEIPVAGELVLLAKCRELGLVDDTSTPRIEFKLGSETFERSILAPANVQMARCAPAASSGFGCLRMRLRGRN
jgi:hypothetical protein